MDWVNKAKELFASPKPGHFTNYQHCDECAEHDETLRSTDVDTIGLGELGNPAWDPICFCSSEGKLRMILTKICVPMLHSMHLKYGLSNW